MVKMLEKKLKSSKFKIKYPTKNTKMLEEIEKYQRIVKAKHPKMKKRLLKHGNQPNTKPYMVKPSYKRSKSAPPGAGGS